MTERTHATNGINGNAHQNGAKHPLATGNTTPGVVATLAGKHLVVTGITGFVGKVWLAMLLDRVPEIGKITVLIRGKKRCSAEDRFTEIYRCSPAFRALRERRGLELHDLVEQKIRVVEAEVTKPLAGLTRSRAQSLFGDADAVLHFAGMTDFEPDPVPALETNVDAAMHVADLCALSPNARYLHCSTAYVAGMVDGEIAEQIRPGIGPNGQHFDPKQEVDELRAGLAKLSTQRARTDYAMERARRLGWANIYTYTKALAEHRLAARTDIRSTTIRPAIVECAREYPFVGWNEGINTSGPIVWLLSTAFRRFPSQGRNHFDVIPVDTVAKGIMLITAAALRDEAHHIYHLGSSQQNPFYFSRAIELTGLGARRRHKNSNSWDERMLVRHLDAFPVRADRSQIGGVKDVKRALRETKALLGKIDLERSLPPAMYERWGARLKDKIKAARKATRNAERKASTVEDMLRQYRPFIHDHDYVFLTDHVAAESARLGSREAAHFSFDIESLDWHHYWLEVQVPGLERWSIPLLRGERVAQDEPLPDKRPKHPTMNRSAQEARP